MIDCRRIVHAWAYRDEWTDIEITLTADSGESAEARIHAGRDCRYTLSSVTWASGRQAYRSAVLGQGEGPQEYQRLRSLGALEHMRYARGLQDVLPHRRSLLQAAVPPPEVAVAASPAAPEGEDCTDEAIVRLCQADKGGTQ